MGGAFSRGITSYMRAGQAYAQSLIVDDISTTAAQIEEFGISIQIQSGFVLDAINTWGT